MSEPLRLAVSQGALFGETLALLAIAVLYVGIYPKPFTDVMDTSVVELLKHVAASKLN